LPSPHFANHALFSLVQRVIPLTFTASNLRLLHFANHALFTQSIVRCHLHQSFLSHFLATPISFDLACNQVTGTIVASHQEYMACLEVADATIMRCTSASDGGAIKLTGAASLSITGTNVSSCRSDANGGAVSVSSSGSINITFNTFSDCSSAGDGGSLYIVHSTQTVFPANISRNIYIRGVADAARTLIQHLPQLRCDPRRRRPPFECDAGAGAGR
jgi:putative component of membrane protein insertase Oxa1/YidC/SpoIIIJ protein YidD